MILLLLIPQRGLVSVIIWVTDMLDVYGAQVDISTSRVADLYYVGCWCGPR